ncbi:PREDICTED: LOW QUALITY PROTEIN: tctex1 domain-containing protein 1-A-like [Trachymyrmex cornetzi]|nr:PREDICTED: LOW QUALITY PROTEIN: tctex1 domain-containing protein 1-A-like [Trachymyrmex cornetzi]
MRVRALRSTPSRTIQQLLLPETLIKRPTVRKVLDAYLTKMYPSPVLLKRERIIECKSLRTEAEKAIALSQAQKYQNSYRMQPQNSFKIDLVDKIVKSVMNNRLDEVAYDDAEATKLCGDIAAEIRRRVKKLNFDRHKIIVTVTIIEKASQSVETTLGFLWDSERDKYSAFSFEGRTFHAQCSVFGVYYE